jgi:hypothetical protein
MPGYRVLDANAKFVLELARPSKQVIVGRQKHVGTPEFRARQVQSIKRAESELRKVCAAFGSSAPLRQQPRLRKPAAR